VADPELIDLALQVLPDLQAARDQLAADPRTRRDPGVIEALEEHGRDVVLDGAGEEELESVVFSLARPALFMHDGAFDDPPPPWNRILEPVRDTIADVSRRVGRIELQGMEMLPYAGTGFLVAEDVVMTNCHVAILFAQTDAHGRWTFKPEMGASLSIADEPDPLHISNPLPGFDVKGIIGIHERLDLALLRVEPAARGNVLPEPLTIAAEDPGPLTDRRTYVIGYPMFDPDANPDLQMLIFGKHFQVKRLQPGNTMETPAGAEPLVRPCSRATLADTVFHDASTLKGNSGSALFDVESGKVLGLHFSGAQLRFNRAVALWRLTEDPLLVKAGVRFG
jgi:hypothetical protein